MSVTSSFFNKIQLAIPIFSALTFILNLLFLAVFLTVSVTSGLKKPLPSFEADSEEEEDEESLLA